MRKIIRIAGAAIYVVLLGEIFVRLFAPEPIVPRYVTSADYGVRANIANARYRHYTRDDTVEYRINAAGFRADREYSIAKPDGACRILMFGDSFMMGYEVDLEHTIPFVTEQLLTEAGYDCEVINMAVSGFGTAEMLVALERNGLAYDPDVVVFQWHRTDRQDNVRSGLYRLEGDRLTRTDNDYLPAMGVREALMAIPLWEWVAQHSQLYSAFRETAAIRAKAALAEIRSADVSTDDEAVPDVPVAADQDTAPTVDAAATAPAQGAEKPAVLPYDERLAIALMREARDLAAAAGARFYLVDIPYETDSGGARTTLDDRLGDALHAEVVVVDTEQALNARAELGEQLYYQHGHGHFTPLGYEVVAQELAARLISDLTGSHHSAVSEDGGGSAPAEN